MSVLDIISIAFAYTIVGCIVAMIISGIEWFKHDDNLIVISGACWPLTILVALLALFAYILYKFIQNIFRRFKKK